MSLRKDSFRKSNFRKGKSLKATSNLILCSTTTIGMMALNGSSSVSANWFSEYAWECWNFFTQTVPGYFIELFSNLKSSGGKTSEIKSSGEKKESVKGKNSHNINIDNDVRNYKKSGDIDAVNEVLVDKAPEEYDDDLKSLLNFVSYNSLNLGMRHLNLNMSLDELAKVGVKVRDPKEWERLGKVSIVNVVREGEGMLFGGGVYIFVIGLYIAEGPYLSDKIPFTSKPLCNDVEKCVDFFNLIFRKASEQNGWKYMVQFAYDKNGEAGQRLKMSKLERESGTVLFEYELRDVAAKYFDKGEFKDEDVVITYQGGKGIFESVFFKEKPAGDVEFEKHFEKLTPFKDRVFKLSKREFFNIVDFSHFTEDAKKFLYNLKGDVINIRIEEVYVDEIYRGLRLQWLDNEGKVIRYVDSMDFKPFVTKQAKFDVEKIDAIVEWLKKNSVNPEDPKYFKDKEAYLQWLKNDGTEQVKDEKVNVTNNSSVFVN